MYRIIRHYKNSYTARTIKRVRTLEEAQAHCSDPETSSSTATSAAAKRRTRIYGEWFDGYERDRG